MSFNILYSTEVDQDLLSLLKYVNDFTKNIGEAAVEIDVDKCRSLLVMMRQDFPHRDGLEKASVFKKVAYFMCYFIGEAPILRPFSSANIGDEMAGMRNHQNAIMALQLAVDSLQGALVGENTEAQNELAKRIELSPHSYRDIIDAIKAPTHNTHFKMLCVLLEQLAYKTNPDCQYPAIDL